MRIFKTRAFARFARRGDITDDALREAIARAERGLVDADLGGFVIKQRVARRGRGHSGGFRTPIAFKTKEPAFSCSASPRTNWTVSARANSTIRRWQQKSTWR